MAYGKSGLNFYNLSFIFPHISFYDIFIFPFFITHCSVQFCVTCQYSVFYVKEVNLLVLETVLPFKMAIVFLICMALCFEFIRDIILLLFSQWLFDDLSGEDYEQIISPGLQSFSKYNLQDFKNKYHDLDSYSTVSYFLLYICTVYFLLNI